MSWHWIGGALTLSWKSRRWGQATRRGDELLATGTWYSLFGYRVGFGSCRILDRRIFVIQGCLMYCWVPSLMPAHQCWVPIHELFLLFHWYLIPRVPQQPLNWHVPTRLLRHMIPYFIIIEEVLRVHQALWEVCHGRVLPSATPI
jgi:hypothetical protein